MTMSKKTSKTRQKRAVTIVPIYALKGEEISTNEHWENVFILLFV